MCVLDIYFVPDIAWVNGAERTQNRQENDVVVPYSTVVGGGRIYAEKMDS